jgi:uncharacterized protein with HEPN domain
VSRSWRLFLEDIVEASDRALRYSEGKDLSTFSADEMAYDAVLRNLQIIGEAAKAVPADVRQRHPEVDWKGMAGLRDVLAHAYFGLDDETLWDVVTTKVRSCGTRFGESSANTPDPTPPHRSEVRS